MIQTRLEALRISLVRTLTTVVIAILEALSFQELLASSPWR